MASKKVIVGIETNNALYEVGTPLENGLIPTKIDHFRDGITGIYKPKGDDSHYKVSLENPDGPNLAYYIPTEEIICVVVVDQKSEEVEEPKGV